MKGQCDILRIKAYFSYSHLTSLTVSFTASKVGSKNHAVHA